VKSSRAPGAATLEEVAQAAGVSLATASRALNGSTRKVNPEISDRVLAAALELNYSPNLAARAVAQGGTSTAALGRARHRGSLLLDHRLRGRPRR
jgi:LacI family transcriptional regulator